MGMALSELCELIVDSEHKTAPSSDEGFPMIRTPNIGAGRFILEGVRRVDEPTYEQWTRRAVPQEGDLILAREAPVGNVAMVPVGMRPILGQRTVLIRPDRTRVVPLYLQYLMLGRELQHRMWAIANGATVPHLNMRDIRALEIPELPPLYAQLKIAAVLAAYDELVENNLRRIEILEEMAQAIYREWFVNFRYPGHEHDTLKDSPLGPVPEGWEVGTVKEKVKRLKAGDTYKQTDVLQSGSVVVVDQSRDEILGYHDSEPAHVATAAQPIAIFGDHTCKMQLMIQPFSLGPNVVPFLSSTDRSLTYLFYAIKGQVSTTEYKRHWTTLMSTEIAWAPAKLTSRFEELARPNMRLADVLTSANRNLRATRDLLLPRLISGELDVSDLDIDTSWLAA